MFTQGKIRLPETDFKSEKQKKFFRQPENMIFVKFAHRQVFQAA